MFQVGNLVVSVIPPLSHVGSAKILHFGEVPKRFGKLSLKLYVESLMK